MVFLALGGWGYWYVPGSLQNYGNRKSFQCGLSKHSRKHKASRKKPRCLILDVIVRLGTNHPDSPFSHVEKGQSALCLL